MTSRRKKDNAAEDADAQVSAEAALSFVQLAAEARELGENDIAVMALKRARFILRRKLIPEDEDPNV